MFQLAQKEGRFRDVPFFPMGAENPARGFAEIVNYGARARRAPGLPARSLGDCLLVRHAQVRNPAAEVARCRPGARHDGSVGRRHEEQRRPHDSCLRDLGPVLLA
jgi:hypothetical protein